MDNVNSIFGHTNVSEAIAIESFLAYVNTIETIIKLEDRMTLEQVKDIYRDRYSEQEIEEAYTYAKIKYSG